MRACVVGVLVVLLCVYIVVGGVVFHFLEWENEEIVRADTTLIQETVLEEYPCLTKKALRDLVTAIVKAQENGVLLLDTSNDTAPTTELANTNWDWYSAIFFATTVVTTIGYGNISPATFGGQIFAVCFAGFGIPLCLIVLGAIGQSLNSLLNTIQECCCRQNKARGRDKFIKGVILVSLGTLLFMLVPAIIFMYEEEWTYWESFYYSFITLTTIGFGDFVAGVEQSSHGKNGHGVYRLCISCWILLGLAWMSSVIALYQDRMEQVIDKVDEPTISSTRSSNQDEKADIRDFQNFAFVENNHGLELTHRGDDGLPSTQL